MKKIIMALAVVFFFVANANAVSPKQYKRLLRDTCIMGNVGMDRDTGEAVSFIEIDRGVTAAVFMMFPESKHTELHIINVMNEDATKYKVGRMTDKDLDGTPDHYQTVLFKDGIGTVTAEGTDTSFILDLWEYWIQEFITDTGGPRW